MINIIKYDLYNGIRKRMIWLLLPIIVFTDLPTEPPTEPTTEPKTEPKTEPPTEPVIHVPNVEGMKSTESGNV